MRATLLLLLAGFTLNICAQPSSDLAIMPWAEINTSTNKITLKWSMQQGTGQVVIYAKSPDDHDWQTVVATLPANTTSYEITAPSKPTEYRIMRNFYTGTQLTNYGNGYIIPAIGMPEVTYRGKLLLVIEKKANDSLKTELGEAMRHMSGDGWQVDSIVVQAAMKPTQVKALIKSWYNKDPLNAKCLFLFGHVPVPYSGLMTGSSSGPMDGHTPDHDGAWVADVYYAEMDGSYTDINSQITGSRDANKNVASDGKFDQITLPDYTELHVTRVDMYDLPAFGSTETQLLRRYLGKMKAYKMGQWNVPRRGLIDDRLGLLGSEGPGRGAWMSLYPQFGADSVKTGEYFKVLKSQKYLVAHEVSYGGYTQYINIGDVNDYKDSVFSVFNSSFGSYFGDWDITNNIIRGSLASPGYTLSNCWNGRPMFFYHAMAMGYTLGYCTWRTQNNKAETIGNVDPYPVLFGGGRMHISAHGDPTLRLHAMKPVSSVKASAATNRASATITWTASPESGVIGYNIYRAHQWNGKFDLIQSRVSATTYTDNAPLAGLNIYMVRAVKPESSASGTYYNQSIGMTDTLNNMKGLNTQNLSVPAPEVFPNPANNYCQVVFPSAVGSYKLSDISGNLIVEKTLYNEATVRINTSELASGIYFITYKNNNGLISSTKIAVGH